MLNDTLIAPPNGRGIVFIISAPAGTGKTTLVQKLQAEFSSIAVNVSFTTRPPRIGEMQGHHYNFISVDEFKRGIDQGHFLEYVELYGNYYGTSKKYIENMVAAGRHVILVIDVQGAMHVKSQIPAVTIFIKPPSIEALKARLNKRGTESAEDTQIRLDWAKHELGFAKEYEYTIINDQLEIAYTVLRSIVVAECHKNVRGI